MVRLFRLCEEIEDRHDYNYDLQIVEESSRNLNLNHILSIVLLKKKKASFHFVQDDNFCNKIFLSFRYKKKNPMIYVFLYKNFEFRLG